MMKFTNCLFALLLLSGCAVSGETEKSASGNGEFDAALAAAKAATKKANAVGYEWRDTGKIMKEAEEAAKAGDMKKAMKLANKAKTQSELAQKQAEEQKNAKPRF